ncbi:MAG: Holliday junction resolvase RuvX [Elusimicrobiota bacterium]
MIVLGVDWGRARAGVALSDELGMLAHPLAVVPVRSSRQLAEELGRLAREHRAGEIVLGLPLNMDGTEGESARAARRLAAALEALTGLPVVLRDERLTSWAAERSLSPARGAAKERKDQAAACLILQSHLDSKRT